MHTQGNCTSDDAATVAKCERLFNIDGVGPAAVGSLLRFADSEKNRCIVSNLCELLTITSPESTNSSDTTASGGAREVDTRIGDPVLAGRRIVFTGKFTSESRSILSQKCVELGKFVSLMCGSSHAW
jgi:NAD-dependent DNA ligase